MIPHITLVAAAVLGLLYVALSVRVVSHRVKTKVLLGDGQNQGLSIAIRTHANFSEYVPLALILIGGVEVLGFPSLAVKVLSGVLVFARFVHVHGVATKGTAGHGRPVGTIFTWLVMTVSAVLILINGWL